MNHVHTFFLTFVILTIAYGMLLISMWKKFHENIREKNMELRYAKTALNAANAEIENLKTKLNREVVEWKKE